MREETQQIVSFDGIDVKLIAKVLPIASENLFLAFTEETTFDTQFVFFYDLSIIGFPITLREKSMHFRIAQLFVGLCIRFDTFVADICHSKAFSFQ